MQIILYLGNLFPPNMYFPLLFYSLGWESEVSKQAFLFRFPLGGVSNEKEEEEEEKRSSPPGLSHSLLSFFSCSGVLIRHLAIRGL